MSMHVCMYMNLENGGHCCRGLGMQTPVPPLVGGSGEQLGITGTLRVHRRG